MVSYILYQLLESELPKDVCQTKTNPDYLQLDERIHALEFFNHMQMFQVDCFRSYETTLINTVSK